MAPVLGARPHIISLIRRCQFPVPIAFESTASLLECATQSEGVRFWRAKLSKFLVIFLVSREFGQRRVSARLGAPPFSLDCREFSSQFSPHFEDYPHFSRLPIEKSDCGERILPAARRIVAAAVSPRPMTSPTSSRPEVKVWRSQAERPAKLDLIFIHKQVSSFEFGAQKSRVNAAGRKEPG